MKRVMRRVGTKAGRFAAVACLVSGIACGPVKRQEVPSVTIPAGAMAADWKQKENGKQVPICVDYFDYHLAHSKAATSVRDSCIERFGFEKESCLIYGMMDEYSKEDSEIYHHPVSVVLRKEDKIPNMHLKGMTVDEPDLFMAKIVDMTHKGVVLRIKGSGICIKENKDDPSYDIPDDFEITETIPYGAIVNPGFPYLPYKIFGRPCTMWDPTLNLLNWKNVRFDRVADNEVVLRYDETPYCSVAGNQKGDN